jgi:hypothetical protein
VGVSIPARLGRAIELALVAVLAKLARGHAEIIPRAA